MHFSFWESWPESFLPADGQLGSNPPKGKRTLSVVPSLSIPEWKEIKPLVVASSSVFLRTAVLQITLSSAAAMAARSEGGAASVAAHQIAIQLWMLCSFVADALAAASQGLVADGIGRDDHDGCTRREYDSLCLQLDSWLCLIVWTMDW